MGSMPVLVVASDDRWLRVLEVTLRLGGLRPTRCRSIAEARRPRAIEDAPRAIILDLDAEAVTADAAEIGSLVADLGLPVVVILPAALDAQRQTLAAAGARVLLRPFAPSALYAALASDIEPPPDGETRSRNGSESPSSEPSSG